VWVKTCDKMENGKMKDKAIRILKILISCIIMYLLCRRIDFEEFRGVIKTTAKDGVVIVVVAYLISTIINAVKWQVLLPKTELSFLIGLSFRAQLYSVVLPGQLFGEASKITAWSGRNESKADVAASVIFDKITGLLSQIIVGIIGLMFSSKAAEINNKWVIFLVLIVGCLLVYFSVEVRVAKIIRKTIDIFGIISRPLQKKLMNLYDSWCRFASKRDIMAKSFIWGFINQAFGIIPIWYLSMRMELDVGLSEFCWINPLMSIILLLPISFAGIGLRDSSLASMLTLFNVPVEKSLILSMSILAGQMVAALFGGIYALKSNVVTKNYEK